MAGDPARTARPDGGAERRAAGPGTAHHACIADDRHEFDSGTGSAAARPGWRAHDRLGRRSSRDRWRAALLGAPPRRGVGSRRSGSEQDGPQPRGGGVGHHPGRRSGRWSVSSRAARMWRPTRQQVAGAGRGVATMTRRRLSPFDTGTGARPCGGRTGGTPPRAGRPPGPTELRSRLLRDDHGDRARRGERVPLRRTAATGR